MKPILSKIYRENPYDGFDIEAHPMDMQGWGYEDPLFGQAITALTPSLIVEVGSWKGMSAMKMGRIVKAMEMDCEIVCVDTWLGSPEHLMADVESWYEALRFKHGYPQLFFTFMSNVIRNNLQDVISPFPATSENAAHVLGKWGAVADLIYIDAAHEYAPAKADFERFWPLLSENGLMIVDDYVPGWPGVLRAVDDFVVEKGLQASHVMKPGKAILGKTWSRALNSIGVLHK